MSNRTGIRIIGRRGNSEVAAALIRYARWLRLHYEFPIRVPVYLLPHERYRTRDGVLATASFFAPFSRKVEPYIRIATGDYAAELKAQGRDNALASYLHSLNHELVHYWQWLEAGTTWEQGVVIRATSILRKYVRAVDRP